MYTNNRDAYRQTFFIVWQKHQKKLPLEPVEAQLLEIILQHPEYHGFLEKPDTFQSQEFALEENPFFHMSLHLSVREQIRMNRPQGITNIYQALMTKYEQPLDVEHKIMQCLAQMLWEAQQTGEMGSEGVYLEKLQVL